MLRHAGLLAGHELKRAMGAEMQNGVGGEVFFDVVIKSAEGVRGCEGFLEQQTHRVAFVAEARLHADEHVAESSALHEDRTAIGQHLARRRSPLRFDLGEVGFVPDVIIRADHRMDIGVRAEALRVAFENAPTQRVDA